MSTQELLWPGLYIYMYIQIIIVFSFILFKKCKGLRNGHNYLFISEFIKIKTERKENRKTNMKLEV